MYAADAWVLRSGSQTGPIGGDRGQALRRARFSFGPLEANEALVEPILGSWEANIDHALARSPIDVCSTRGEDAVVLGNLGVVRVLKIGPEGRPGDPREGDLCLLMPFGACDRYGYAELVHGYDAPRTIGLLARRSKMSARLLLPIPPGSGYSLAQWATYGRYFTAWDNWHKASACWRTQVPGDDPGEHLVFGWGGGVTLAELSLARREGFRVAMTAASDDRIALLRRLGIVPVDRRRFPDLMPGAGPGGGDREWQARHRASMTAFLGFIEELSDGRGVAIFVDNIGEPLYKATTRALAREAVITTCGWKAGMRISQLRGAACIRRQIQVNTHVWRLPDSPVIRDFQQASGWIVPEDATAVYGFDQVAALASEYAASRIVSYFPLYQINPL